MRLRLEADVERDFDERFVPLCEQLLGSTDPPTKYVVVRAQPGRCAKASGKVHAAEAGRLRQVGQRDGVADMLVDVGHDALQLPLLQSICRLLLTRAQSEPAGRDGKADGICIDAVAIF